MPPIEPVYDWHQEELLPRAQMWLDLRLFLDGAAGQFALSATLADFWTGQPVAITVGHSHPLDCIRGVGYDEITQHLEWALNALPPF
jgi:myo-inositol catabolism protein IolC